MVAYCKRWTKSHVFFEGMAVAIFPSFWSCWTIVIVIDVIRVDFTPKKSNMTMDNQPFEDVSPIENGDFSLSC